MPASVVSSVKVNGDSVSSLTSAALTVSGNNRVLFVWVVSMDLTGANAAAPTAVRCGGSGGTDLSLVAGTSEGGSGFYYVSLWRLDNPPEGTPTIYAAWSASQPTAGLIAVSAQDADLANISSPSTDEGTTTSVSINQASAADDLVLGGMAWVDFGEFARTVTSGGSQTSLQEIEGSTLADIAGLAVSSRLATGNPTALAWTISGAIDGGWRTYSVSIPYKAPVTPTNSSGLLQADDASSPTLNAGFTFTAGRQAVFQCATYSGPDSIVSVTIGGTAATRINTTSSTGGTVAQTWFADDIAGGTANIVINTDGGAYISGAVTEWPAGTFDGTEADNIGTGSSTAPAVSVTIANPSVLFATVAVNDVTGNANLSGPSGYTVIATEQNANEHSAMCAAWKQEDTAGSKTATFGSNNLIYGMSLVALRLASATPEIISIEEVTWATGANPAAQNISIPGDAEAVVAVMQTYSSVTAVAMTLNGATPDLVSYNLGAGSGGGYIAIWLNPPTGTQALDPQWTGGTMASGCRTQIVYVKGFGGVRSYQGLGNAASAGTARSFNLTTEPGDFVLAFDSRDDATPSNPSGWDSHFTSGPYLGGVVYCRIRSITASGSSTAITAQEPNWSSIAGVAFQAGGGAVELDGAIGSESTAEGSLQLAVGLQGGLTSVSTVQGSLGLAMPLEGAVSSVSRLSGGLGTPTALQGTIASASDAAGTLGLVQGLTGTIRSESELTGELDSGGAIALTGTISSVSQVQGQFALATALTGAIASASDLAGDLTVAGDMSLVGTAASVSAVQGRLGLATELTGIAESTSQAVGGLGLNLLLSSEVRSVSGVHGSLGLSIPLSGTISSESALSGELSIAGSNALEGAISSVSALRGELNLSIGLAGSSRSESSLASELTIGGELALSGTISSVSRLSGSLSLGPYIDMQESITLTAYGSVQIYSSGTRLFTV